MIRRLIAALVVGLAVSLVSVSSAAAGSRHPTHCLPSILKHRLSQIRSKFGPVTIISTLRRGARIAGSGRRSKHADCRAVDFKVRNMGAVYRWLNKVHKGGVGIYYGRCNHIHIDDGPKARWRRNHCG
jgi:uncharacterized protein YcbK (DUF882 family)